MKLWASILKDLRLLLRDKVGLLLMFAMPVLLVLVITSLQNNTFKIVNDHKVPLVVFNQDGEKLADEYVKALGEGGMFDLFEDHQAVSVEDFSKVMSKHDALVGLYLKKDFSKSITQNAEYLTSQAMSGLGVVDEENVPKDVEQSSLEVYYSPVLQESYRMAVEGTIKSAMKVLQSKKMLNLIYYSLNEEEMPENLQQDILHSEVELREQTITSDGSGKIPDATQHNVPAWTIFAMFFMVTSLGSSIVREKQSGSFIRLKTMPGGYLMGIFSKQIVYLIVALLQVFVIFSIGALLFPYIGLPALEIPKDISALLVVSIVSGLCAVSYAMCIGIFSSTEEQTNGFGAVSIVILAALGGVLVPSFAMPDTFQIFTGISPLHWCLEAYYDLFLAAGSLQDILGSVLPIILIVILLQTFAFIGIKQKNLI